MAITVAQLGDVLGVPTDANGALSAEDSAELQRLLDYAEALITAEARDAPDAFKDLATQALVGYLYDRPTSERGTGYANAWVNSGAANILKRYVQRRVFTVGELTSAATSVATGGLDRTQVNDAIADRVTGAFVVALLSALEQDDRLSLEATSGDLPASRLQGTVAADNVGPVGTDATLTVHASRVNERISDLDEFEASLRQVTTIADDTNPMLVLVTPFQQYALGGSVVVPAQSPDAELRVTITGLGTVDIDLSAVRAKPAIPNNADLLSSANAVAFGLGDVTFFLGRADGSERFRFGADTAGTYGVRVQLLEADLESFARKSSADLIGSADLDANQRLPAPEDDKWLKWASGALVNTDAPSGGGNGAGPSQEQIEDYAAAMLTKGDDLSSADVDAVYDDSAATVALQVKAGKITPAKLHVTSGSVGGRLLRFNAAYDGFEGAIEAHAFSELRDSVLGIAINTQQNVQQTLTAFTTALTLGADDHGLLLVSVSWTVPASSQAQLALGDDVRDTEQLNVSDLRATADYLGGTSAKNGLVASTVDVHAVSSGVRGAKVGTATLYVAHDADGNAGTYMAFVSDTSANSRQGSVQAHVEVSLLRMDYTAPAPAPSNGNGNGAATPTPKLVFELAPASGFITNFIKGQATSAGWGALTEAQRVAALNGADWIYGVFEKGELSTSGGGVTYRSLQRAFPFGARNPLKGTLPAAADTNSLQNTFVELGLPAFLENALGYLDIKWGWAENTNNPYTRFIASKSATGYVAMDTNRWKRMRIWTL